MYKQTFIPLPPFGGLQNRNLKYKDVLTYIALRSFLNYQNNKCHPSQMTIAEKSGLSKPTVIASLIRLQQAKLIDIKRSNQFKKVTNYYFTDFDKFIPVPSSLLECTDLTSNEKAILLCVCQYFDKDKFETHYTLDELARVIGISTDTLGIYFEQLCYKGYILPKLEIWKDGQLTYAPIRLSDKLDWKFNFEEVKVDYTDFKLMVG